MIILTGIYPNNIGYIKKKTTTVLEISFSLMTDTRPQFQFNLRAEKLHFLCCDCGKSPCDLLAWPQRP